MMYIRRIGMIAIIDQLVLRIDFTLIVCSTGETEDCVHWAVISIGLKTVPPVTDWMTVHPTVWLHSAAADCWCKLARAVVAITLNGVSIAVIN